MAFLDLLYEWRHFLPRPTDNQPDQAQPSDNRPMQKVQPDQPPPPDHHHKIRPLIKRLRTRFFSVPMEETLISTFAMFLVLYIAFRLLPTELFVLCENDIWQIVDEET